MLWSLRFDDNFLLLLVCPGFCGVDLVIVVVLVGLDVGAVAAAVFSVCVVVVAGDRDDFAVVV